MLKICKHNTIIGIKINRIKPCLSLNDKIVKKKNKKSTSLMFDTNFFVLLLEFPVNFLNSVVSFIKKLLSFTIKVTVLKASLP